MRDHLPEYLIEGLCLGLFMVSAAGFATLLQHPASPVAAWMSGVAARPALMRLPMGLAMGLTAAGLIYSPFGRRSGAHMNPVVTLTFWWLGKVRRQDAIGYVAGQFAGGLAGLVAAVVLFRGLPAHPSVNYVATTPGEAGRLAAFAGEAAISFLMMTTVLELSSRAETARITGIASGLLVAVYITFEEPLSGMSMNPARTLPSNLLASMTSTLWIYFSAPLAGMLAAGAAFVSRHGIEAVACPKLHHTLDVRCIFCGHVPAVPSISSVTTTLRASHD